MTISTNGLPTGAADLTLPPSESGQYSVDVAVSAQQKGGSSSWHRSWTLSPEQIAALVEWLDSQPSPARR